MADPLERLFVHCFQIESQLGVLVFVRKILNVTALSGCQVISHTKNLEIQTVMLNQIKQPCCANT